MSQQTPDPPILCEAFATLRDLFADAVDKQAHGEVGVFINVAGGIPQVYREYRDLKRKPPASETLSRTA